MFDLATDDESTTPGLDPVPTPAPAAAGAPLPDMWRPSRYTDQPTSLRTRLFGVGGTALVVLLFAAGALLTWTTYQVVQQPATLTVFDVAPPAAPPEPVQAVAPEPEKMRQERNEPQTVLPTIEPPEVPLVSDAPVPASVAKPSPDPAPPKKETAAPEPKPVPPAPPASDAKPTWQGQVLAALNKVKRYPREASFRRQQGVPYIRFVMNRAGVVLSVQLERSSGFRPLDNEALALPKRASPLPKPPEDVRGDSIELVVPVEFFMR
jgi:periplasmic protein TonB